MLREPLVHFAVLGALLFAAYAVVSPRGAPPDAIVVGAARIEALAAEFERTWMRAPTAAELDALVEGHVREEVLVREGLALGLDRDDPVIRRRVRQKMELLAEEAPPAPSDAELQAWLDAHPGDFVIAPTFTFEQVYLDPERHGEETDAVVARALADLAAGADATQLGDATLLPASLAAAPLTEVERTFGPDFARALPGVEPGAWRGPIPSTYGLHLVRVGQRTGGRAPALAEVRDAVERAWSSAQARAASEARYRALRDRYRVAIERPAAVATQPPVAVAP
jgi:hypothetical protein